jgi:hypothetical protein
MHSTRKPSNKSDRTWNHRVFIGLAAGVLTVAAAACSSAGPETAQTPVATTTPTAITAPTTTEPVATTVEDQSAIDVSDELRAVADEYLGSYEARDNEAFLAIVTDDYRFVSDQGQVLPADQARDIDRVLDEIDWGLELLSDYVTTGTDPYTVEFDNRITAAIYPSAGRVGTSTLTIVDDDGTLKVSKHVHTGESLAPPN